MAKIRRIVRKLPTTGPMPVEEQLWPIYVALVLFGAFLMGVTLYFAYAEPRPGAARSILPFICLPLIPLFIGSLMALLYFVNTRVMRRGVQLAMVLSVIAHFFIFLWMYGLSMPLNVARKPKPGPAKAPEKSIQLVLEELPLPVPQQRDFEQPVETPTTPAETTPELEKQQPDPEPTPQPETPPPQPQETEKPQPTPSPTERAAAGETAPRFSEQPSLLSKQTSRATPSTNRSADAPQVAAAAPSQSASQPRKELAKQNPSAAPTAQQSDVPSTTTHPSTESQVARRSESTPAAAESSPAPAIQRQATRAQVAPTPTLAKVDAPSTTKATDPSEPTPRNVALDKRATASPQLAQSNAQPSPETPLEIKPQTQTKAIETEKLPTLAQAAESVPVTRPRETARPNIASVAASVPTANTPQQSSTSELAMPASTTIAKASPASNKTPAPIANLPDQPAATAATPSNLPRRSNTATPTDSPATTIASLPGRQATKPGIASSTQASVANPTTIAANSAGEVSPSGVAVSKQATESPQTAPTAGAPNAATLAGTATTSPAAVATNKRPAAENAPTLAQQDRAAGQGRSTSKQALNIASTVDTKTNSVGAQMAADAGAIGPSSSQLARQESNSPGATSSRQPLATESLTPSTQIASSNIQRATAASSPTINPSAAPNASPARAASSAAVAASPANVETPSLAATATGQGDPLAQPARMALTKSLAGTAGVGQSPNLDRSLPAADSASLVASGSARREKATQNSPDGAALAPSSTAFAGRSQASNSAPSTSLRADTLENATQSGSSQVALADATAGAAISKQSSNADQGPISAAVGQVEVDLGPTQIVADSGSSSRASGGGQPTINTQTQSKQLARRTIGGSAAASLATDKVAEIPVAPAGTGGGAPKSLAIQTEAAALARTDAGGSAAVSGGPAAAAQKGPATEVSAANLVGDAALARNQNQSPGGAPRAAGEPNVDAQSQAARTIGRTAGGAPQVAIGGAVVAEVTNLPQGEGGQPTSGGVAQPGNTSLAKGTSDSGAAANMSTGELAMPSSGGAIAAASVGRAEAAEAAPGAPTAGGGEAARSRRTSSGPAVAANTVADVPSQNGASSSGGQSQGTPVASSGAEVSKQVGGSGAGNATSAAPVGEPQLAGGTAQPGAAQGQRSTGSSTANDAPVAAAGSGAGAPGRRASTIALAGGSTAAEQVASSGAQLARAEGPSPLSGMERGQMARQEATGSIPVNVAADDGPGGLGSEVAMDVGINSRRASSESMEVQTKDSRFIRQKVGGNLNVNTSAIVSTEGFRRRGPEGRGGGTGSVGPQTEQSVELGLVYLERHQLPDGSWSLQGHDRRQRVELSSDTAATALAVLAFQGAGYNHREHKYKEVVNGGLQYLLKNQHASGDLFMRSDDASNTSAWMYSHALATLALCEAYGMTGDPALREPAQKAIDFIVASQSKELGGWRYRPREMSDTSVTGWMMMALKSGEYANLTVPAQTYAGVRKWLDISDGGQGKEYLFRYDPNAPDTVERRHGRVTSKTMTSVGLLMRLYLGWQKTSPEMQRGAEFLLQNPPHVGTVPLDENSIAKAQRDTYYWYYTTQVMWHIDGETNGPFSTQWLNQMHPLLLRTQIQEGPQAGSWDPLRPEPDRWGLHAGRLYVTTMNLLSLEVKYRYLPIYANENAAR